MDIEAAMLRAVGALNHMADTCQYLEQKAELRQISQELISARLAAIELIETNRRTERHLAYGVEFIEKQYPQAKMLDRAPILRNMRHWRDALHTALARIGAANG